MAKRFLFLLPLWEKVAWTKSAPDEGSLSVETDPSSVSNFAALIRATFSHKGRRKSKKGGPAAAPL
jgi:hypothetical protein